MGIDHEKLFYALKHSEDEDYKHIMKRFYPEKYKRVCATPSKVSSSKQNENPAHLMSEADPQVTADPQVSVDPQVTKSSVKRKLSVSSSKEKENGLSGKRAKKDQTKSENDRPSTTVSLSAILSNKDDSSPKGVSDPKGVKKVLICQICPPGQSATYKTEQLCRGHMAEAHFQDWILDQYPAKDSKCGFPDCSVTLHSAADRAKHLGLRHKQVLLALQSHSLVSDAKKKALDIFQTNEESANPKARDKKEVVKPLRSGSLSEVLGSLQPQKNSSPQVKNESKNIKNKILVSTIISSGSSKDRGTTSSSKGGDDKTCNYCGGWLKVWVLSAI